MQDLQDLVQDLASLAIKILARFGYYLQDGFYWDVSPPLCLSRGLAVYNSKKTIIIVIHTVVRVDN